MFETDVEESMARRRSEAFASRSQRHEASSRIVVVVDFFASIPRLSLSVFFRPFASLEAKQPIIVLG